MKRSQFTYSLVLTLVTMVIGCVEPYDPPVSDAESGFMVIDGFIDSGSKSAVVKLSKAVQLDTNTTANPVKRATVLIEQEDGSTITLPEVSDGTYSAFSSNIQTGKKYRLHVSVNSRQYTSDEVELRASPSLDSVNWRADEKGVTVYVDSHDVAGSTRYYQWIYTETWEYSANKFSTYLYEKNTGTVRTRRSEEVVFICYNTEVSTKVLVTTTSDNSLDVVNDFALAFVPAGSIKISRLYSIEVEQRALDEEAFSYWLNLQKTTENLGGLFDPLPSEVTGNMRNVNDDSEKVLGYFQGGEIQRKRIFIYKGDLPPVLQVNRVVDCPEVIIPVNKLSNYIGSDLYLIASLGQPVTTAYTSAPGICVDCRLGGGVLKVPSFWPPR